MQFEHSAIAVLEYSSITRGLFAVDVATKKSPIKVLWAEPMSQGKFVFLFAGGVAEVEEAYRAALEVSDKFLIEEVFIPQVVRALGPAIGGHSKIVDQEFAVGMLESTSIAASVLAADVALKTSPLALNRFRLGKGIGGRSYFIFSGELDDVQAGLEAAIEVLESKGALIGHELIARPHADFLEVV